MDVTPDQTQVCDEGKDVVTFRIAVMSGMDPAFCKGRLHSWAQAATGFAALDPRAAARALKAGGRIAVIYQSAPRFVAAGFAAGKAASVSLEDWQAKVTPVFDLWRSSRRNVILVEETTLLTGSAESLALLTASLGDGVLAAPLSEDPAAGPSDMVFLLLAREAVLATPRAMDMNTRLEAGSLRATGCPPALRDVEAEATRLQALMADRNLLGDHITELQGEIEARIVQAHSLQGQISELTRDLDTLRKQAAQQKVLGENMASKLIAACNDRDDQARELVDARDTRHEILKQSEERELALRNSLQAMSQEYGKLITSRSWKLTEPLRAANSLLRRSHKED